MATKKVLPSSVRIRAEYARQKKQWREVREIFTVVSVESLRRITAKNTLGEQVEFITTGMNTPSIGERIRVSQNGEKKRKS
jgi:hypothetical protein